MKFERDRTISIQNVCLSLIQPGSVVGEECLLKAGKYGYTVIAKSNKVTCLALRKNSAIHEFQSLQIYNYLGRKIKPKKYEAPANNRKFRDKVLENIIENVTKSEYGELLYEKKSNIISNDFEHVHLPPKLNHNTGNISINLKNTFQN